MSCFVVLFSVLFRLQLNVGRSNCSQVFRIELACISVLVRLRTSHKPKSHKPQEDLSSCFAVLKRILCEGALRHRDTRELYSNNLRAVGPQDETEQKIRQQNKTRDQNKINK